MIETVWEEGWHLWDLISHFNKIGGLTSSLIYRGQRDASWGLLPGLYRREVNIFGSISLEDRYLLAEQRMLDHFFERAYLLLPGFSRGPIVDRIVAQHYGVPTQLLDWTIDPFIAMFFACQETGASSDGAIFYIQPLRSLLVQNPINLPFKGKITLLRPPILDERIKMQKSVFTLQSFGSEADFVPVDSRLLKFSAPSEGTDQRDEVGKIGKIVIPSSKKRQIRFQLLQLGVDSSLLFPGLQGIGERIADYAEIQSYGGSFLN